MLLITLALLGNVAGALAAPHRSHHRRHRHRHVAVSSRPGAAASSKAPRPIRVASDDLTDQCAEYARQGVDAQDCVREARIAKAATAKYVNFSAAQADGFVKFSSCEHSSAGAMGEHWARLDRNVLGGLDAAKPQILLYLPTGSGMRLLGAEYEQTAFFHGLPWWGSITPDMNSASPRPSMFGGERFQGPMEGHNALQPWHYDLHVWLWAHNPSGLFAQYNPNLSC